MGEGKVEGVVRVLSPRVGEARREGGDDSKEEARDEAESERISERFCVVLPLYLLLIASGEGGEDDSEVDIGDEARRQLCFLSSRQRRRLRGFKS